MAANASPLPLPIADYIGVAWLASDLIVVDELITAQGGARVGNRLILIDPASGTTETVELPATINCWRDLYESARRLPDGRLGLIHICLHNVEGNPPDDADVVALDPRDRDIEPMMPLARLTGLTNVQFAVTKDLSMVVYEIGGGPCVGIAVATAQNSEGRLHATVEGNGRKFTLDTPQDLHSQCDGQGQAGSPTLSDANTLGFVASPEAVGVTGLQARIAVPRDIYVMGLTDASARRLAEGLDGAARTRLRGAE